jgi:16S rRNA U516 pseudouridylate synthase RsuA-like enzyme
LRFGPLALGDLRVGTWREETEKELTELRALQRSADAGGDDA